jgi:hypothetical protein
MRYSTALLSVLLLCTSYTVSAQQPGLAIKDYKKDKGTKKDKYTLAQFDGRWQEKSRMGTKSSIDIPFEDTLYIRFYDGNKATSKEGKSVVITGSVEIYKDDYITTSATDYKIVSISKKEMVLDDNMGFLHTFAKTNQFAYELAGPPPPPPLDAQKETVDLSFFKTNWYAYRRGANPGFVKSETPVIKKLNITEKAGDNTYKGQVEYARYGKAIVEAFTLTLDNSKVTIAAEGNTWNMELYNCTAKELIMGKKGELVYYFNNDAPSAP